MEALVERCKTQLPGSGYTTDEAVPEGSCIRSVDRRIPGEHCRNSPRRRIERRDQA